MCITQNSDAVRADDAESLGFAEWLADDASTAHRKEKDFLVFNDIDLKRVRDRLPSSASHTSPSPLNFTLAPRNAGRIAAPK